ncbi:MAG TPA: aldo/keto reductase [Methanocorpusculum sp.]|nr:aldo/keto reductase [Methanocorpusculum sp.]
MLYSEFKGLKLSKMGFGMMRLPLREGGSLSDIDEEKTAVMIQQAFDAGINYFDTARPYHLGMSEKVTGKLLRKYPRDSYFYADKFPGLTKSSFENISGTFEEQLSATGMEYFDFYLLHNVCDLDIEWYLSAAPEMIPFLSRMKEEGRIRHIGFSIHGSFPMLERFMAVYGHIMEFCQIQLNWFDWNFQDAKAKVAYLNGHNIPIWVMEPLRGGRLVNLPPDARILQRMLRAGESAVETAFRFLQSVPGVAVILSGASSPAQMEENTGYFASEKPVSEEDKEFLFEIAAGIHQGVACTKCRYCTDQCRKGLNIQKIISIYNDHLFTGNERITYFSIDALGEGKKPFDCIGCGECEAICPQGIRISEVMADFCERLKK